MPTYLLTWNPKESSIEDLKAVWRLQCKGKPAESIDWSCGSTKSIPVGARVFLHRQREEPRGIVASGWVTRQTYQAPHWRTDRRRRGEKANYVDWRLDAVVPDFGDDETAMPLQAHLIPDGPLHDEITWDNMVGSGISVPEAAAAELERLWALHVDRNYNAAPQGETLSATENRRDRLLIWSRSRERSLRDAKIRDAISKAPDRRLRCEVPGCGFCFEEVYGNVGEKFAHVHHLNALSGGDEEVQTTLEDLAIVCANCHAMIHRNNECRPLNGLVVRRRR
jgi:5-methylcytosine-specific restriction protein A